MTTLTGLKDNVISDNLASFEQIDMKAYGQVRKESYIWGALRIAMGWIFLWSFLDKLFGFGFSTSPDKAWVAGGSPTFGFLNFGTSGPLAEFYQAMAGNATADSLYMLGMLVIGLSLVLGIGVRVGAAIGVVMTNKNGQPPGFDIHGWFLAA